MNFTLKSFFSFKEHIGRLEYFVKSLLINVPFLALFLLLALFPEDSIIQITGGLLSILLVIAVIIAAFALVFQRLNDLQNSKWLILLGLIPLVNFIFAIYLLFAPGKTSEQSESPIQDLEETSLPSQSEDLTK